MTEPRGAIHAARQQQYEREQRAANRPPGRHTADSITDDELDALYARVEKAEATIERVHAMCDAMEALARASFGEPVTDYERGVDRAATCVRTSLNPPEETP